MFETIVIFIGRLFALLFKGIGEALDKFTAEIITYRATGKMVIKPADVEVKEIKKEKKKIAFDAWTIAKIVFFVLYLLAYILAVFGVIPINPKTLTDFFKHLNTS